MARLRLALPLLLLLMVPACSGGGDVITADKYQRIHTGMLYSEVAALVGTPGEELSRSGPITQEAVVFVWKNGNGSNMIVTFGAEQHGRGLIVTGKAQYGLR